MNTYNGVIAITLALFMPFSVPAKPALLQLWFAGPALQLEYDPQALTPADRDREAARLAARKANEWRVSRALQRRLPGGCLASSLSHSAGHALWAASGQHGQIGVDLERLRPIDELALAELIAHDDEKLLLRSLQGRDRNRFFFRLWTLKEALLKAAGGNFPADMLRVGLRQGPSCHASSHADPVKVTPMIDGPLPMDVARAMGSKGVAASEAAASQGQSWRLMGLGERRWHGLSAMIGTRWMMAVVWPDEIQSAQESALRILAREALPGDARALRLEQCVAFGVMPTIEAR